MLFKKLVFLQTFCYIFKIGNYINISRFLIFMTLDKLPSIIRQTKFNDNGLAVVGSELLVPGYVASQLGFSVLGRDQLAKFYDRLRVEAKVLPLCPFIACAEYIDFSRLNNLKSINDITNFWEDFNKVLGPVNYGELMPRSKLLIAILDGAHAIDDGTSAEIGFYAGEYKGMRPIVGIRSDFRLAENLAAPINPAVRYFMDTGPYSGLFFSGPDAYDSAVKSIASIADKIRKENS
jgi:hypothetical protein